MVLYGHRLENRDARRRIDLSMKGESVALEQCPIFLNRPLFATKVREHHDVERLGPRGA